MVEVGENAKHSLRSEKKGRSDMQEDFKVIGNYLMVKLPEEIDHHQANYISQSADRILMQGKVNNVVFDFEDTKFMDSSGIGIIAGRYKKVVCFEGKVYAINVDRHIRRILYMSGLDKMIEIIYKEEN